MNDTVPANFTKFPFMGGEVIVTDFPDGNFSVRCKTVPPTEYVNLMRRLMFRHGGRYSAIYRSWNFENRVRAEVVMAVSQWSADHG